MTKKFTEEQYQNIVKAGQSENVYIHRTQAVIDYLIDILNVDVTLVGDEALAIANPLTREWAHDKFVEKEKKYYWTSKKQDDVNDVVVLRKFYTNMVIGQPKNIKEPVLRNMDFCLTESEIKVWGYNPEMFDREEV